MIDKIKQLLNHGIRKVGVSNGKDIFAGMQNGALAEVNPNDDLNTILDAIREGKTTLTTDMQIDDGDEYQTVSMKIGPQGGLHVLVNGEWLRVRK